MQENGTLPPEGGGARVENEEQRSAKRDRSVLWLAIVNAVAAVANLGVLLIRLVQTLLSR